MRTLRLLAVTHCLLLMILGCGSTREQQRRAHADEYNNWLGKYKDSRIIEVGPPDHCIALDDEGETCEWRTDGNTVVYRYDDSHVARHWTYTDNQFGEIEGTEEQPQVAPQKQELDLGIWQSIKDSLGNSTFIPGGGR